MRLQCFSRQLILSAKLDARFTSGPGGSRPTVGCLGKGCNRAPYSHSPVLTALLLRPPPPSPPPHSPLPPPSFSSTSSLLRFLFIIPHHSAI
eukprot:9493009-Pyramimonas_sp.AAC.1